MVVRILVIVALVCAVLAFFGVHVGSLTEFRLAMVGLGSLAVACLL